MPQQGQQVSVIIPTWNRAKTVRSAVLSALAQTHAPLEVLVCDDGSSDDSERIVRSIGDTRVRWISGPRGGNPAIPRNRGMREARGDWLAFLDSDDTWLPEKIERQLAALDATGGKACCTDAWRLQPNASAMPRLLDGDDAALSLDQLLKDNRVICSSALIHRSLLAQAEGFPEAIPAEDYALWLRIACETAWQYVGATLLIYCDAPQASARASFPDAPTVQKLVVENFLEWCSRHPNSATISAAERITQQPHVKNGVREKLAKPCKKIMRRLFGI